MKNNEISVNMYYLHESGMIFHLLVNFKIFFNLFRHGNADGGGGNRKNLFRLSKLEYEIYIL